MKHDDDIEYSPKRDWLYLQDLPIEIEAQWGGGIGHTYSWHDWTSTETLKRTHSRLPEWAWENIRPYICKSYFGHIWEEGRCVFCTLEQPHD